MKSTVSLRGIFTLLLTAARGTDGKAQLHFVTCPDSWMPLLARGLPALSASDAISRNYFSRDGGLTVHRMSERPDLGFFNVTFDKGAYPSTQK